MLNKQHTGRGGGYYYYYYYSGDGHKGNGAERKSHAPAEVERRPSPFSRLVSDRRDRER